MRISHYLTSFKRTVVGNAGITLLEIVVTLGVVALLSGVVIGYGRGMKEQLTLTNAEIQAMNLVMRARSMAVSSFLEGDLDNDVPVGQRICAYGVHLDVTEQTFFIFRDLATDCTLADRVYTGASERISGTAYAIDFKNEMVKVIAALQSPEMQDVVFIPPDPIILLNNDPALNDVFMTLETKGRGGTMRHGTIDVSDVGKVKLIQE